MLGEKYIIFGYVECFKPVGKGKVKGKLVIVTAFRFEPLLGKANGAVYRLYSKISRGLTRLKRSGISFNFSY